MRARAAPVALEGDDHWKRCRLFGLVLRLGCPPTAWRNDVGEGPAVRLANLEPHCDRPVVGGAIDDLPERRSLSWRCERLRGHRFPVYDGGGSAVLLYFEHDERDGHWDRFRIRLPHPCEVSQNPPARECRRGSCLCGPALRSGRSTSRRTAVVAVDDQVFRTLVGLGPALAIGRGGRCGQSWATRDGEWRHGDAAAHREADRTTGAATAG